MLLSRSIGKGAATTGHARAHSIHQRVRGAQSHIEHWEGCGEGAARQQDMGTWAHARAHSVTALGHMLGHISYTMGLVG